ncbi:hypothetical protein [Paenibacillus cremeus]|uniref:Uncharacterized protein n=1 Tax=Paenibacillus cremeus TaxID=2163881 RepID=A0A559KCT7_9BACL|nr:hypothetical protein [Paenibacillus cremeus]TVY09923.1 hypothetical protein FPZ49_11165 [Paenibacillus cremeus]
MKKAFQEYHKNVPCWSVVELDDEIKTVKFFNYDIIDGHLLMFGEWITDFNWLGVETIKQFEKGRAKQLKYEVLHNGFDLYHLPEYEPKQHIMA